MTEANIRRRQQRHNVAVGSLAEPRTGFSSRVLIGCLDPLAAYLRPS